MGMGLMHDALLHFGSVPVTAAEAELPNVIHFGKYGPLQGKPIGIYAKEAVSGSVVVKIYTGDDDTASDLIETSRGFTADEINSGEVKVYIPLLPSDAEFIKVSVTGSTAGGVIESYLESYAGK
jgi:hypothetical protein